MRDQRLDARAQRRRALLAVTLNRRALGERPRCTWLRKAALYVRGDRFTLDDRVVLVSVSVSYTRSSSATVSSVLRGDRGA